MDETGLFHKLIPRHTYVCENEDKRSVQCVKEKKFKDDRITAYHCTDPDGSDKRHIAVICKSINPRYF